MPLSFIIFLLSSLQPPSQLRFTFTRARQTTNEVQLSDIFLYSTEGHRLEATNVDNPDGSACGNNESPAMLFDGSVDTKWCDLNFSPGQKSITGSSKILFELPIGTALGGYEMFTSGNPAKRDPTEWTVSGLNVCGQWVELDVRAPASAYTRGRKDSYGQYSMTHTGELDPASCTHPSPSSPPQLALVPLPPLSPPAPPSGQRYALTFYSARGGIQMEELQLAEVALYGLDGQPLVVLEASNPGGVSPQEWEGADAVIDGDLQTKWVDSNFARSTSLNIYAKQSRLELVLWAPTTVAKYDVFSANTPRDRDPTSWVFTVVRDSVGLEEGEEPDQVLHSVEDFQPPWERRVSYTAGAGFEVFPLFPSMPPTAPPPMPPSLPPVIVPPCPPSPHP